MKIVIEIDGGMVSAVSTDAPADLVIEVETLDHDCEGRDDGEMVAYADRKSEIDAAKVAGTLRKVEFFG